MRVTSICIHPPPSDDPSQDPDYSMWGSTAASVKYQQFIPYLIKGIQEIVTELPRSKTTVSNTWGQNITGLVVSANTNTHKTNVTPIVTLSNVAMDKSWYGVVSDKVTDTNDHDTLIDIKGDTKIWVTNMGGTIESGDLVTTSNVLPGYCQKQGDDIIRSYTVAKVTQDCDFTEPQHIPIKVPRRELTDVTYYVKNIATEISFDEYNSHSNTCTSITKEPVYFYEVPEDSDEFNKTYFYHNDIEVDSTTYTDPSDRENKYTRHFVEKTPDEYEALPDEEKTRYQLGTRNIYKLHSQSRSTRPIPEHTETIVVNELKDVLDENGQIVWEETNDTRPVYTLVDHGTYKSALLTCKIV
jgi:hypothetical protein